MRSFAHFSSDTAKSAIAASTAETQFLPGGTTLIDLMKLEVMQPKRLIDINPLHARYGRIERTAEGPAFGRARAHG
jgi:xanthine dehydrogenase YagS FAD-binding subunit